MLKIYGWKRSRAARCMWVMEEMGLQYEQVPLNSTTGENRTPEYLRINPAGKIPALDHDGFILTETVAINFYLTSTFPGTLLPRDSKQLAQVHQWTSWAITELDPPVIAILREGRRPKETIDASRIEAAKSELQQLLDAVLEPHLTRHEYLLGSGGFTLADLHVAAAASVLPMFNVSLDAFPASAAWLKRCLAREAYQRSQQRA
jgi:glutathione S-transferase